MPNFNEMGVSPSEFRRLQRITQSDEDTQAIAHYNALSPRDQQLYAAHLVDQYHAVPALFEQNATRFAQEV